MVAIEREKARIKAQKAKEKNETKKKRKKKKAAEESKQQTRKPTGLRLTKALPSTSPDHVKDR